MVWTSANGPKCPVSPEDRGQVVEPRDVRAAAIEECAKIVDAECERILSAQTPTSDPFSMTDTVNLNLRMMAAILPNISAAIRGLAHSRPDGK